MSCGDEKLSKYLTQTFTAHCNAMICQQVTLLGDAEWPKVADAVIEAEEKAQTLWLLSFISTPRPPVSRPTVLRVRRLRGPTGTIVAFRLSRDGTEGSALVCIETLRVSVTKKRYSSRT